MQHCKVLSDCCRLSQRHMRAFTAFNSVRQAGVLQQAISVTHFAARTQHRMLNLSNRCLATSSVAEQQRMYIVDLMPYMYKAIYSAVADAQAAQTPLQEQHHQNTQWGMSESNRAAYRVMADMFDLIGRKQDPPTHMAIVVDVPGPTFRHLKYPQYKGKRPERSDDFHKELSCILAILDAAGIPILAVPGVEADDVTGTLAKQAAAAGMQVVLVTTDKDSYQLLQPNVCILRQPSDSSAQFYTQEKFIAEFGLSDPKLWIDVKALEGDASDNIPGVKGIGRKSALQLVQQYGSVECILQCFAAQDKPQQVKLNKRQVEMLSSPEGATAAKFAKQLVSIVTDLKHPPVRQALDSFKLTVPADGGKAAVERAAALNLPWTAGRLDRLFKKMIDQAFLSDDKPLNLQ